MDSFDSYPQLVNFVEVVSKGSGVSHFVIHARKCLLKGLNPHQNRTVPPLRYEWVWALKRDFPHLEFSLNGGVLTLEEVASALALVNGRGSSSAGSDVAAGARSSSGSGGRQGIMGVMVGRAAYNMPWDALGEPWPAFSLARHPVCTWLPWPSAALLRCLRSCCHHPSFPLARCSALPACRRCRPRHFWRRGQRSHQSAASAA